MAHVEHAPNTKSLPEKALWWTGIGGLIAGVLYNINFLAVPVGAIIVNNLVYERPRHAQAT